MFGWLRRKTKPAPTVSIPAGLPVIVRATGIATTRRQRSPSIEEVMSAAVTATLASGRADDAAMAVATQKARADLKQARASADATGRPVTLHVGDYTWVVHPDA